MRAAALLARRVGRRGAVLSCKGVMCLLYGWSQVVDPPPQAGIRLLTHLMPQTAWGWVWITIGLIALGSAIVRQGRDWIAFAAVYLIASAWGGSYLASWWLYDNPRGWAGGIVFAAFGGVAAITADWPEPVRAGDRRGP
jgi:hypothetical protein